MGPFKEKHMKKLLIQSLMVGFALVASHAVAAQADPSLTAKMEDCFRAHARLMDKPSIRNMRDCWRVHAYLMEKRQLAAMAISR